MTRTVENDDLKPCPFCGGTNISIDDVLSPGGGRGITCLTDNCMGNIYRHDGFYPDDETLINAWNTRADHVPQPVTDAERQAAMSTLNFLAQQLFDWEKYLRNADKDDGADEIAKFRQNDLPDLFAALSVPDQAKDALTADATSLQRSEATITQPVDVEALKMDYNKLDRSHEDYDYAHGYNAAIDHIAQTYDLVKKVK